MLLQRGLLEERAWRSACNQRGPWWKAVAHDGKQTLAMLRRRPHEPIPALLARLDAAIAAAQSSGSRIDEINTASSDKRYEI